MAVLLSRPAVNLGPERVDERVELGRALLERLVRLVGKHVEQGAGNALGDDAPVAGRSRDVDAASDDEGRHRDLRQPVERIVSPEGVELAPERLRGLRVRERQRLVDDCRDEPVGVGARRVDPEKEVLEHRPLVGRTLHRPAPGVEHRSEVGVGAGPRADENETAGEAPGFVTAWPTGFAQPTTSAVNADLGSSVPVIEQHLPDLATEPVGAGGKVSIYTLTATHLVADVAGFYQAVFVSHEGRFMPVDPARLLDTRAVGGPVGYSGAKPAAGQTVSFPVAGHGGVPATGASAVMLTVTATETNSRGFVTAFPAGGVLPWASNVSAEYANQTMANQVVVPLGANGEVSLYTQNGTHLVVDVAGWFTDGTQPSSATGLYHPIAPTRYLDSRADGTSPRPSAVATRAVPFATTAIPAGEAAAVLYNLTGAQPAARGFVIAFTEGDLLRWASNLNLERPGQTLSALATTKVGTGDEIDLYTQWGTHLVVDVMGWFRK